MPTRSVYLLVGLALLAGACGGSGASDPAESPSFLISLTSIGGSFSTVEDRTTLDLTGVDEHMIAFADRPNRDAAVIDTAEFLEGWEEDFGDDPPNAVLVEHSPTGAGDSIVLVLTDPVYDADAATLSYTVTVTTGEYPDSVASLVGTPHTEAPDRFEEATLFIDGTSWFCGGHGVCVDEAAEFVSATSARY